MLLWDALAGLALWYEGMCLLVAVAQLKIEEHASTFAFHQSREEKLWLPKKRASNSFQQNIKEKCRPRHTVVGYSSFP